MSDPLESARYTAAHAKTHATDLTQEIRIFLESKPYIQVVEPDTQTGDKVCKLKLAKPMPVRLNGLASDAVNNFRSALDQAGYATSVARSGSGVKYTHFPFGDTPAEVKNRKAGGSKDIPDEIFAIMESFKPYFGGNDALWVLNKFCNANKHRIVCPAAITTLRIKPNLIKVRGHATLATPPRWDSEKNEMELFRLHQPGGSVDYNVDVTTTISFSDVNFLLGRPVDLVLSTFGDEVDCILDAIEAEGRRIGLFA